MSNIKKIVAVVALCFSSTCFAGGEHSMPQGSTYNEANSFSKSNAAAVAGASVGVNVGNTNGYAVGNSNGAYSSSYGGIVSGVQGGSSSVGFSGNSTNTNTTGGNQLSNSAPVTVNNETKFPKQVPSPSLYTPMSTAQCRHAIGGMAGGATFVFGFNVTFLDEGCDIWRDVENMQKLGEEDAAFIRACDKPEIAAAIAKRSGRQCPVVAKTASKSQEWNGGEPRN